MQLLSCDYDYTDINECSVNNAGCTQGCHNKKGGFECSCWKGYAMQINNNSCIGMWYGQWYWST